jgi:uncharacterized protein (TIGR02284 family)
MDKDTRSLLNELVETSKDGEKGYTKAAEEIADPQIKSVLLEGASRCRAGARELQEKVVALGGEAETSGSALGAMHRGWINVKTAVTPGSRDAKSILEECERGEDYAKARYAEALRKQLPDDLRMLVQRQYEGVVQNHDKVKALRDAARAARH